MMRNALFSMIFALFMALGTTTATASTLQSNGVTLASSDAQISRSWLHMNPATFTVSTASVVEQFDRVARRESRLTPQHRARLMALLEANQGVVVSVPDGIGLDYLTGRNNGSPFVYVGMRKQLGREDRALMFELGDGVIIYWFTGVARQSCNNIGVVLLRQSENNAPTSPVVTNRWRMVQGSSTVVYSPVVVYNTGIYIPGCNPNCCPPQYVNGAAMQMPHNLIITTPSYMTVVQN